MTRLPQNEPAESALQANNIIQNIRSFIIDIVRQTCYINFAMKNTTHELFEKLLGILQLCYTIIRTSPSKATVTPLESDKSIFLECKDNALTITVTDDQIWVFKLEDQLSVGTCTLKIENILIQEAHLFHGPIALTIYLYYRLLGLLWGTRTIKELREQDPTPDRCAYTELYGPTRDGKEIMYIYRADSVGTIWVEKYIEKAIRLDFIRIDPTRYIENPVKTVEAFFSFFNDILYITKVGRG